MLSILPTSTSSGPVHPSTPLENPSLGSATLPSSLPDVQGDGGLRGGGGRVELPDRSRWSHRMSDYFLGPPAASRPRTAWGRTAGAAAPPPSVPPAGGGDEATTTPAYHDEPSISLLTFAFRSDGDNEALAADGWRWRLVVYFKMLAVFVVMSGLELFLSPQGWVVGVISVALGSAAAIASILAFHQNSSYAYLQRKQTVATIITAIVLLGYLGALCSSVFVGVDWHLIISQNVSCVRGCGLRQSAVKILVLGPVFNALLLPTSRGARWVGIVFQLTVAPAAQVSGGCVECGVGTPGRGKGCWQGCLTPYVQRLVRVPVCTCRQTLTPHRIFLSRTTPYFSPPCTLSVPSPFPPSSPLQFAIQGLIFQTNPVNVAGSLVLSVLMDAILPTVLLILIHAIRLNAFRTTLILQRTMSELDNCSQNILQISQQAQDGDQTHQGARQASRARLRLGTTTRTT